MSNFSLQEFSSIYDIIPFNHKLELENEQFMKDHPTNRTEYEEGRIFLIGELCCEIRKLIKDTPVLTISSDYSESDISAAKAVYKHETSKEQQDIRRQHNIAAINLLMFDHPPVLLEVMADVQSRLFTEMAKRQAVGNKNIIFADDF